MAHPKAKLDPKRDTAIRRALKLGYSESDLIAAIDGCSKTPHNMGDNDRGERYDGLDLILRDAAHIDRFIANAANPPKPRPANTNRNRPDPDDPTRDRYGRTYGSVIVARELGLMPQGD